MFRLTVTDDDGATATDDVTVNVAAEAGMTTTRLAGRNELWAPPDGVTSFDARWIDCLARVEARQGSGWVQSQDASHQFGLSSNLQTRSNISIAADQRLHLVAAVSGGFIEITY